MLELTRTEFTKLGQFIQDEYGIKMPEAKKTMLQARLQKRLRLLGIDSFSSYIQHVFESDNGREELVHMIDAVTTNKTDFFREPNHFSFLKGTVLPGLVQQLAAKPGKITAWSAGCSTGEEPYTMAMVMDAFLKDYDIPFTIIASDISRQVLEQARLAIYDMEKIAPVPMQYKKEYCLKSKDKYKARARIVPELRTRIVFRWLNFMASRYDNMVETMDFIFCRNVIIYFERNVQAEIIGKLITHLRPGGYLFLGHSETIFGMDLPLRQVASTVYQKIDG